MPKWNDIDVDSWRDYLGVLHLGSLWLFKSAGEGGDRKYPGNFIPQIPLQTIQRFTKREDLVVDLFAGSETTADVCEKLGRRYKGCDLRPRSTRTDLADARTYDPGELAQLVILHPPYGDIIDYNVELGCDLRDLSLPQHEFIEEFRTVAANAHKVLKPGGYAVLVMGDAWSTPLKRVLTYGFKTMDIMRSVGFVLKGIHVKDFGDNVKNKGKNANLWFYRALKSDFNILEHEYVFILKKKEDV